MIDFHAHLFPDEAMAGDWLSAAGFDARLPGTPDDYLDRMAHAGIERAVVLLFPRSAQRAERLRASTGADEQAVRAMVADEIDRLNEWGCALAARDPSLHVFVAANPRFQDRARLGETIRRAASAGASGIKIIPPALAMYPDDPALDEVYRLCTELDLPLLSQSGDGGAPGGDRGHYGRPAGWRPVLAAHPTLRLVLAHMGRGYEDELVRLMSDHANVMTDTSLRLGNPRRPGADAAADVAALIRRIGSGRVLFGTNYPVVDPLDYRLRFDELGLSPWEAAAVGRENAERFLRLVP